MKTFAPKLFFLFFPLALAIGAAPINNSVPNLLTARPSDFLKTLTAPEQKALNAFLIETERKIPAALRKFLPPKIEITFATYDDRGQATTARSLPYLNTPLCKALSPAEAKLFRSETYGEVQFGNLKINERVFRDIFDGPSRSHAYSCRHKTMYRLAQATLLHEIGHLLDDVLATKGFMNSSTREFINLVEYRRGSLGFFERKNFYEERSPDPYEFKSPREAFAVNLEYFLLDETFACRRPALHQFYVNLFGVDPFRNRACKINPNVTIWSRITRKAEIKNLNPSRLYRVDYLLADKGEEMMSKMGHAMLRLVYCAPERKTIGPDCEKDLNQQLVVSYAANLDDLVLNTWKGIFGGYTSEQFIFPLPEIVYQYTQEELRNLLSFPIVMSQYEKTMFVDRLLEKYWAYEGHYRFAQENCATEARDILRSVMPGDTAPYIGDFTPISVLQSLQSHDRVLLRAKEVKLNPYLYFPSKGPALNDSFEKFRNLFPALNTAAGSAKELWRADPSVRRKLFTSPRARDDLQIISQFLAFEEQARIDESAQMRKRLAKMLEEEKNTGSRNLEESVLAMKGLERRLNSPAAMHELALGYGIPLASELHAASSLERLAKDIDGAQARMKVKLKRLGFYERSDAINENMKLLYDMILEKTKDLVPADAPIVKP